MLCLEIIPRFQKRTAESCQQVASWSWETLESQLIMPKNIPGH